MELEKAIEGLNGLKIIFEIDNGANFEATPVTQKEIAQEIETLLNYLTNLEEKNKELEEHQKQYLDGELITAKQGKFFEKMIKEYYIRKDKIKEKIKEREHIIHNSKLKYGPNYYIYDDVIYAIQDIKLYEELLEEE